MLPRPDVLSALFGALVALEFVDARSTWIILKNGRETWPPMLWLMEQIGVVPALALKLAIATAAVLLAWQQVTLLLMVFVVALNLWVVVHNLNQLRKPPK